MEDGVVLRRYRYVELCDATPALDPASSAG